MDSEMKTTTFLASAALAVCMAIAPAPAFAQHPGGAPAQSPSMQPNNPSNPNNPNNPSMQPMPDQNTQQDNGSNKMMKSADARFAMKAAQGGMAEVQLGQLAAQKAGSPDVKAFGQQMVDDHSKANDQLKTVASKENMTLPATLDSKDQALYTKLQSLSGAEFDKAYVKAMVKDHQEDVKEFQKEADKGKDSGIKSFASETLPVLQQHLSKIESIQSNLGGSPTGTHGK
jgi:putative membrane protein